MQPEGRNGVLDPFVVFDNDWDLEHWREQVEDVDPFLVACRACSAISEEGVAGTWCQGCSWEILSIALDGGGEYGFAVITPHDAGLLRRLYERLDGWWPEYTDNGLELIRRRWRVRWVNDRDNPFVDRPAAERRMSHTRAGGDNEPCACHHLGREVTQPVTAGPPRAQRVVVFPPPEGCDLVFYTCALPPSEPVAYAEIEAFMTRIGR